MASTSISISISTSTSTSISTIMILDLLEDDSLSLVMDYVGSGAFFYVAGTCHRFHKAYIRQHPDCLTCSDSIVSSKETVLLLLHDIGRTSAGEDYYDESAMTRDVIHDDGFFLLNHLQRVSLAAAFYGRLDVLTWLAMLLKKVQPPPRPRGAEGDVHDRADEDTSTTSNIDIDHKHGQDLLFAACCGRQHVQCLDFILEGYPRPLLNDEMQCLILAAIVNGRGPNRIIPILKYFHNDKGYKPSQLSSFGNLIFASIRINQPLILKFIFDTFNHRSEHTSTTTNEEGHHQEAFTFDKSELSNNETLGFYCFAASQGHLACLRYLHEELQKNGISMIPYGEVSMRFAATNENVDCLKYLHEKGPYYLIGDHSASEDEDCCWAAISEAAALSGSISCLRYIHENVADVRTTTVAIAAAASINSRAGEHGDWLPAPGHTTLTLKSDDTLRFLNEIGCDLSAAAIAISAFENEEWSCLEYLRDIGAGTLTAEALSWLAEQEENLA